MTVEEQLRTLHGQLALIGELLDAVAVASPLRGGEGLSADAAHAGRVSVAMLERAFGGSRSVSRSRCSTDFDLFFVDEHIGSARIPVVRQADCP